MTAPEQQHATDVKRIQAQVRSFFARHEKVRVYHGSTNSTRAQRFDGDRIVDVSSLNRVLDVNADERYALVEPNVPMDTLVEATLPFGVVLPVVMEFPGITVGGGVQGGAGESSSFRHGLLHDTCLAYEVVLGNGEVVTASPDKHPDLFYGTTCSYGSLGIITLVKLRLIPAKQFVRLAYHRVRSFDEAIQTIKSQTRQPVDFVDGILFSRGTGVVITGNLADQEGLPVATFRKPFDEWFYLHARRVSTTHRHYEEIVPIVDYLFRYDRGGFWVGKFGFTLMKIPYLKLFRALLHKLFTTRTLFRVLHATNLSQRYFVQDICVPQEHVLKFLEFVDHELRIYPLWLCPLKSGRLHALSPTNLATPLVINVGVWGETAQQYSDFVRINRATEKMATELKGRKVLYAHQYYSPDEFWSIYDGQWYRALRKKYFADTVFPDVYEKTRVRGQYKPSVRAGLWNILKSPFKLPTSRT